MCRYRLGWQATGLGLWVGISWVVVLLAYWPIGRPPLRATLGYWTGRWAAGISQAVCVLAWDIGPGLLDLGYGLLVVWG